MTEQGKLTTAQVAELILEQNYFAKDASGRLYCYENGVYRRGGEGLVKKLHKTILKEKGLLDYWTEYRSNEVVKFISIDAPRLWDRPPRDVINVQNGLLDIETGKLKRHSPTHLSTIQLPVKWKKGAKCHRWTQFVRDVFPEGCELLAWEIIGWLMAPDESIQKAVLLYGEGGNGKSTYLDGVKSFLGGHNVSNVTLQDLDGNRFSPAQLLGKLANIAAELPQRALADSGIFKAITGGDEINAEFKHGQQFSFRPFAKLLFSSNQLPKSNDKSQGFGDRWLIVPFNRRLRGTKEERSRDELAAELNDPEELSGVLVKALRGLRRLRRKGRFSEPPSGTALVNKMMDAPEPVEPFKTWLEGRTHGMGEIACDQLRRDYEIWAETRGAPKLTAAAFGKSLKAHLPGVKRAKRGPKGVQTYIYEGISLKRPKLSAAA